MDRRIAKMARTRPTISSRKMTEGVKSPVSPVTRRRRRCEAERSARSPRKVPLLETRRVLKSLQSAKEHIDRPEETFCGLMKVRWFCLGLMAGDSLSDDPQTLNSAPVHCEDSKAWWTSIMIWGCLSYYGVGPIYRRPGITDQSKSIRILEEVMLPYAEEEMPLKSVFQQDNDPKHTSKRATSWFRTNKTDVMERPARSPGLNPIENLWVTSKMQFLGQNQEIEKNCGLWSDHPGLENLVTGAEGGDSEQHRRPAGLRDSGYTTEY